MNESSNRPSRKQYRGPHMPEQKETVTQYLSCEQVAVMLQVSKKSVFRWARNDPSMPCLRIGGTVRFPQAQLCRWLAARQQGQGKARRSSQPLPPTARSLDPRGNGAAQGAACANSCANRSGKREQKAHA